jgi:hypothetical protein
MKLTANSPEEYIAQLPKERKEVFIKLRDTINKNIPSGFEECINYGISKKLHCSLSHGYIFRS